MGSLRGGGSRGEGTKLREAWGTLGKLREASGSLGKLGNSKLPTPLGPTSLKDPVISTIKT